MHQVAATYEGEGPNTTAAIPKVADINAAPAGGTNANQTPQTVADTAKKAQARTASVAITRRRQLRTSDESAREAVAVSVGGGDQVLANAARGVYVSVAGNIVCRLVDDTIDSTFANLAAGTVYPLSIAIVRQTGTTATAVLLF